MDDLNDLYFFSAVVQHNGFSAAARATGVEKTRLSRRVAELERRVGVRLMQRSTRKLSLTEAGQRFYERCTAAVDGAQAAYESLAELQAEPSGKVRLSCPVVMAQSYLAPILPGYLTRHPKVSLFLEATDRSVAQIEERFDLVLRARPEMDGDAGMVVKTLGTARRILVASPAYLDRNGRPADPSEMSNFDVVSQLGDQQDGVAVWSVTSSAGEQARVRLSPRLVSSDLRVQHQATLHGVGIALMPEPIVAEALRSRALEQVLPEWAAGENLIHLVYPPPRGMLPSVRSLIDYLVEHLPKAIQDTPA
ncbi:LysR substrate-binding domain-containing protein [Variovorax saccharolyticus]|uniref:LysR substrate-binding domain-containing protein n=1 Tax=Variovorax saccharolyticus TaxID=3053516 RepID=UPI0025761403|nr:LysR substrate-binding domain-containing protein [Variovorax sp. J22R187]MDM0018022.1 LysR substrate-binding domain-containing protein [Variovorax sp. J22R187]